MPTLPPTEYLDEPCQQPQTALKAGSLAARLRPQAQTAFRHPAGALQLPADLSPAQASSFSVHLAASPQPLKMTLLNAEAEPQTLLPPARSHRVPSPWPQPYHLLPEPELKQRLQWTRRLVRRRIRKGGPFLLSFSLHPASFLFFGSESSLAQKCQCWKEKDAQLCVGQMKKLAQRHKLSCIPAW